MAYSLRLPDALDAAARARSDYLGISFNALVCVALDAYLRGPGEPAQAGTGPAPGVQKPSKTSPASPEPEQPAKLTRAEKQVLYEKKKRERQAFFDSR